MKLFTNTQPATYKTDRHDPRMRELLAKAEEQRTRERNLQRLVRSEQIGEAIVARLLLVLAWLWELPPRFVAFLFRVDIETGDTMLSQFLHVFANLLFTVCGFFVLALLAWCFGFRLGSR